MVAVTGVNTLTHIQPEDYGYWVMQTTMIISIKTMLNISTTLYQGSVNYKSYIMCDANFDGKIDSDDVKQVQVLRTSAQIPLRFGELQIRSKR
jgi:hypothetical protein